MKSIDRLPGLRPGACTSTTATTTRATCGTPGGGSGTPGTVLAFSRHLAAKGLPVPRCVVGGDAHLCHSCRPGLAGIGVFARNLHPHDQGYGARFPDLAGFAPAALLLTRVISRPRANWVTLTWATRRGQLILPWRTRCVLLGISDYRIVLQNEEHLVLETPGADQYPPGTEILAIPTHICPTCALHQEALVVADGRWWTGGPSSPGIES